MDVNQQAIEASMKHYHVNILLHGHTHRPAIHDFESEGQHQQRIVLGDWYQSGSVLSWDSNGPQLVTLKF